MSDPDHSSVDGTGETEEADSGTQNCVEQDNEVDQSEARGSCGGGSGNTSPGEGPSGCSGSGTEADVGGSLLNALEDGGSNAYCCDQCNYKTVSLAALHGHYRYHEARKMFECDVCNMKFSNGANMRRHKMRHTGVKPYECRICQKRFFRKDHLMEHLTTHTKALPYHCPICNKGFQRQIAMRAHFQNEHVIQTDAFKSCPLCSYRAGSMKGLRVHFSNRHGIDLDNPSPSARPPTSSSPGEGSGGSSSTAGPPSPPAPSSPMHLVPPHFLMPHVEISMATSNAAPFSFTSADSSGPLPNGGSKLTPASSPSGSPQSDSNVPSSSLAIQPPTGPLDMAQATVKQEPMEEDEERNSRNESGSDRHEESNSLFMTVGSIGISGPLPDESRSVRGLPSSSAGVSLIKVSPLKSLLRDDARRHLPRGRPLVPRPTSLSDVQANGTITSSEQEICQPLVPSHRPLQCLHCGIAFPDQTLYFLHKGCHSDSNPWKCNICGEQCCNVYDFNSHLLSKTHQ